MSNTVQAIGAIVAAVIGLAIVAVIVSKNAQTPSVISAASSGLSSVIQAAVSPVSGGTSSVSNLLTPSSLNSLVL
jgi:hypothetical protein